MAKNLCFKTRKEDNPYEIWRTKDSKWIWKVLKKYQADDNKHNARWLVAVKSPYTFGEYELGDAYCKIIMAQAIKSYQDATASNGNLRADLNAEASVHRIVRKMLKVY